MARRKILKADVKRVALCRRGMNGCRTLYKGDGVRLDAMVKSAPSFDERGELLAVIALPPGQADLEGDAFATPEALRGAAHSFMRNGGELDLEHDGRALAKSDAYIAESFLIQPGDQRFQGWADYEGNEVDVAGGWGAVVKIDSPALRKSYRDGEWDGVSLYARAEVSTDKAARSTEDLRQAIRAELVKGGLIDEGDDDVKPEEISKAVTDALKPVTADIAALVKALTPAAPAAGDPPKPAPKADESPAFEGDPTSVEDLKKHAAKVRAHELRKSGKLSDPKALAELIAAEEAKKLDPKAEREALRKSNPELAKALDERDEAEARVARLQKGSNQSPTDKSAEPAAGDLTHSLLKTKQAQDDFAAAKAAAKLVNEEVRSPFALVSK